MNQYMLEWFSDWCTEVGLPPCPRIEPCQFTEGITGTWKNGHKELSYTMKPDGRIVRTDFDWRYKSGTFAPLNYESTPDHVQKCLRWLKEEA